MMRSARPPRVRVVDTTAAGDAFTAALAVAHAEGVNLADSLAFANAAGAACCTVFGAQLSLPTRAAVDAMIR
jgi:ribokinase